MRAKLYLSLCALLLAGTAFFLLKMGPEPVADRELPVPTATDAEVSALHGHLTGEDTHEHEEAPAAESDDRAAPDSKKVIGAIDSVNRIDASQAQAYMKTPPLSAVEKKSVETLLGTFFSHSRGKQSLNKMMQELTAAGLDPVVAKDFNPDTGKMLIIRTNEALPGTRYFHAQYFEDDDQNKEPFRQHMSFEIRNSPDCMSVARKMVEARLGKKLGQPTRVRGDEWAEWKKGGESIWIQRLAAQDLSHDRFNARTGADIGTCRVAIEQIPGH